METTRSGGPRWPRWQRGARRFSRRCAAIRGTSAAYAAGYALLFLATVVGPYRRGDKSAWWALLVATSVVVLLTAARTPLLGLPFGSGGTGPAAIQGALVLLALLLDVGRLRSR